MRLNSGITHIIGIITAANIIFEKKRSKNHFTTVIMAIVEVTSFMVCVCIIRIGYERFYLSVLAAKKGVKQLVKKL